MHTQQPRIEASSRSRWAVYCLFGLATLGAALGNLSQTGLNAMLPSVMADFGIEVELGQWLTTGYMLVLGIAVPLSTFLMKRLDDRQYLLACFGIFALGSFASLIAPEFFSSLIGRVLQAISVGLIIPKMQTVAMTKFVPGKQATAMGIAGIALGFAPNVGPTIGGAMDFAFGWRSFFALLLAISAALFVLTLVTLKKNGAQDETACFETVSFIFSTLGFGGLLLGLSQASSYSVTSPWVWAPAAVGILFIALFVRRQRAIDDPLIDLGIFKSRIFVDGLMASVCLFACFMGITLVIPLYVTNVLGGTSLDSGLVILPTTITALIVNPLSGILFDRTSPRLTCLLFGAFLVVGSVAFVFVGDDTPYWALALFQAIRATGVSGLIGPLLTYALADLKGPLIGHGSTASVVIRQVAATFGTAAMVLCITVFSNVDGASGGTSALPYQVAFGFSALMAILSMAIIVVRIKKD